MRRQGLTASLKKGGQLYETNAEAKLQYAIHQDLFRHGAYQHAIDQRAAAITHAGGDPAKDPILQQLQIAQANHASGAASGVAMSAQRQQQRQAHPAGCPRTSRHAPARPAASGRSSSRWSAARPRFQPCSRAGHSCRPASFPDRHAHASAGPRAACGPLCADAAGPEARHAPRRDHARPTARPPSPKPLIGSESAGTTGALYTIPKAHGTGAVPGIANAASEFAAGLTSPANVALMAATGGAGIVGDLAAGTRLAMIVKGAQVAAWQASRQRGRMTRSSRRKAAYAALHDPKATRADKAKAIAGAILSAAMTAAAAHGTKGLGKGANPPPVPSKPPQRPLPRPRPRRCLRRPAAEGSAAKGSTSGDNRAARTRPADGG